MPKPSACVEKSINYKIHDKRAYLNLCEITLQLTYVYLNSVLIQTLHYDFKFRKYHTLVHKFNAFSNEKLF